MVQGEPQGKDSDPETSEQRAAGFRAEEAESIKMPLRRGRLKRKPIHSSLGSAYREPGGERAGLRVRHTVSLPLQESHRMVLFYWKHLQMGNAFPLIPKAGEIH